MELYNIIDCFRSKILRRKLEYCMNCFGFASPDKFSLLCVGCGNGVSMIGNLLPLLPNTITRIVGVDTRADLIEIANYKYRALRPRVTFQQMDLQDIDFLAVEKFDHLISFWDVSWLHNVSVYLTNCLKCLRTNGIELVIFESKSSLFGAILTLSYRPKWERYLKEFRGGMTPYQLGMNPGLGSELIRLHGRRLEYGSHVEHDTLDIFDIEFEVIDSRIPVDLKEDFYDKLFFELNSYGSELIEINTTYTYIILQK